MISVLALPLLLLLLSFAVGALPLVDWITRLLAHKHLEQLGTGNRGVSAAFYHGGTIVGLLAVLSEAAKGILVVLLARHWFPSSALWEQVALISLVCGRFWVAGGAGVTNLTWGYLVHDWSVTFLVILIGLGSLLVVRERRQGKWVLLACLPLVTAAVHPYAGGQVGMAMLISLLLASIFSRIPDDLALEAHHSHGESRQVFAFFQGRASILNLDQVLDPQTVGAKAATLSLLRRSGYLVPPGWILMPGDDVEPILALAQPSPQRPLVVRSSAIDEDGLTQSAAGQYLSVLNLHHPNQIQSAIQRCWQSYDRAGAIQYRWDNPSHDTPAQSQTLDLEVSSPPLPLLIQPQIMGVFSGVAFSRDPLAQQGDAILIEALPGGASAVVSGQVTPEVYRLILHSPVTDSKTAPQDLDYHLEHPDQDHGQVPPDLIAQVGYLVRHLEQFYHGIPQDLEWSYDGQKIWVLQCRPITTLYPIWTRKIAAEVIPGLIRPLTWSINRPLTCGVWGDLFTLVLGDRAQGLDFMDTATLHFGHAYFNASLLGDIFQRMGLPPESLEFLTLGAKFSKPPFLATLRNLPGLWRLLRSELRLVQDFEQDDRHTFQPALTHIQTLDFSSLTPPQLWEQIQTLQTLLRQATRYSILAPLSFALRQTLWGVPLDSLDAQASPEVASLESLKGIALALRQVTAVLDPAPDLTHPQVQEALGEFLQTYGYLSAVGTDIAVPTWREDPSSVLALLTDLLQNPPLSTRQSHPPLGVWARLGQGTVQRRLTLKGRVTSVYSQLLAYLRYGVVALEKRWLDQGCLEKAGDIFFLTLTEVAQWVDSGDPPADLRTMITDRHQKLMLYGDRPVPPLVYGHYPPDPQPDQVPIQAGKEFQGIGASPGQVEGIIQIVKTLGELPRITNDTILVVPYTDSGWVTLVARAAGVIAEVGGQLSHGAIVAREYGIPAVMNVTNATRLLRNGERVRLDGRSGRITRLDTLESDP